MKNLFHAFVALFAVLAIMQLTSCTIGAGRNTDVHRKVAVLNPVTHETDSAWAREGWRINTGDSITVYNVKRIIRGWEYNTLYCTRNKLNPAEYPAVKYLGVVSGITDLN